MDPLVASIVVILGKYGMDKGVELGKEVGPKALDAAREMFTTALDYLRSDPKGAVIVEGFEEDPETYEKPVKKQLAEAIEEDPEFKAKLESLLAQFEADAEAHGVKPGTLYRAELHGKGAIAQGPGATAVGARGVNVGGCVQGGTIVTGDRNVVNRSDEEEEQ